MRLSGKFKSAFPNGEPVPQQPAAKKGEALTPPPLGFWMSTINPRRIQTMMISIVITTYMFYLFFSLSIWTAK